MNTVNEWCKEINEYAKEKGWWEKHRTPLEIHMLVVSEIAEATEEVRNNRPDCYQCGATDPAVRTPDMTECWNPQLKPEGEAVELVDAVIRIMDYFEHKGWDMEKVMRHKHEYNKTRAYRHGGKTK